MIEELWSGLIGFSSQFIIPDWGGLIALLPVLLLIPVVLFLTWTIYKFATAGPTRRGKHRLQPVAPEGIHMPGPSFAPFLGGVRRVRARVRGRRRRHLAAGRLRRPRDHAPVLGARGAPRLRPHPRGSRRHGRRGHARGAGRHARPRASTSRRPRSARSSPPSAWRCSCSGLVIGGWALFLGFIVLVITLFGWLLDARKEYRAVEDADRTGHLDMGGSPAWPKATFAAIAVLVAFAALFSSGLLPNSASGEAAVASPAPGGGAAPRAGVVGAEPCRPRTSRSRRPTSTSTRRASPSPRQAVHDGVRQPGHGCRTTS